MRAGAEIASIATPRSIPFQAKEYEKLNVIPFIRQILIYPPLILNPPMNKRTGVFERVSENPLNRLSLNEKEWLCYPAKVGELIILIYFNQKFYELGYSLCNLFELAEDHELTQRPDAVYCYGVDEKDIEGLGKSKTIFYDDSNNKMFVAAVPSNNEFGYFGYLKKMVLTLHNIIMIKRGIFPFHGALLNLILPNEKTATILLIGDTGAGKSETIEAMRDLGKHEIQDMIIIADDMGSIQINADGDIIGYGTEIGAFLRLDDLKAGYAFGQIDRTIIMSPNKTNARIVLPVTTFDRVIRGHKIDLILYANNYDEIDEDHPIVEKFDSAEQALKVFREGTVMSKGTTTSTGIVHSYFANVFGPPQYKELHDQLAKKYFMEFYRKGLFVGQMRTRLGIAGYERTGPEEAAKELLKLIKDR
ncbi:MAG TPA: phosphoenolpyruvate carboxykinase [Candidatus Omnitrophica bacterium]|nr:phosphoenolpyruvate carboxykinase [Candidatus Omnitrophota bacterium]